MARMNGTIDSIERNDGARVHPDTAPDVLPVSHQLSIRGGDHVAFAPPGASVDPYAGQTADNGKEIWTPEEAAGNLHRYGVDWTHDSYGALDDGVLTYGFWTFEQFLDSYFFELRYDDGSAFNDDAYYAEAYGAFEAFTAQQEVAAAHALGLWDDLIDVKFQAVAPGETADIMFGAVYMSPAAGAHAYYPQAEALDEYYGTEGYGQTSGDVMINWLYNSPTGADGRPEDTSFSDFSLGSYGNFAITHELGHSLGLAHGGDYNASDDGEPITYDNSAYFYQDSQQYTIMSYFDGRETGQAAVNWDTGFFSMAQTPAVHDILAVQNIYGADYSTRAGNTTYGFNSNAGTDVFDFTLNKAPIVTIWDGGGNDTLDLSGFNSDAIIDLNEGAFSSAGYRMSDEYLAYFASVGIDTQPELDAFYARNGLGPDGRPVDNIAIAYGAKIENAVGGSGDDRIIGNALNNTIKGNAGVDVVTLGAGKDTFIAQVTADKTAFKGPVKGSMSWDVITDFTTGQDHIDLSGLASMAFKGMNATKGHDVTYKVFDSVNGAEKALGIDIDGHDGASDIAGPVTVVFGNVDSGNADFAIVLLNHNGVTANDFIF